MMNNEFEMFDIVEEGASAMKQAKNALSHAAEVEFAPGLATKDVDLKRTEDCRFSPSGQVIAVAGFVTNTIMVFKLSYRRAVGKLIVTIEGKLTVKHPSLILPHGVDFVDENTLAVANREGCLVVLRLPDVPFDGGQVTAELLYESAKASRRHDMKSPGSVAVVDKGRFGYQMLACLNYSKRIAQQKIFTGFGDHRAYRKRIALKRGMDIPDGISVCPRSKRMAISNHDEHAIRVYPSYRRLSKNAVPSGRLMGSAYPHGVRFIHDGRGVLVADAGAPLIHYWRDDTTEWHGDHQPTGSFKIMDDATFLAGRHNAQEGGPKGLDIHPSGEFLVLTSEQQGFAAYDLSTMLAEP